MKRITLQYRAAIAAATALVSATLIVSGPPASAQTPTPQNPSPMVERTRAHERLEQRPLDGVARTFTGPAARPVEVFVPRTTTARDTIDVVIHFHGASWLPHQAVAALERPAVAAVVNLGSGSGAYHSAFTEPSAFDSLLSGVVREVADVLGATVHLGEIALVAFSAGHGAVRVVLREPRHFAAVRTVLLLDGMHTSYVPGGTVLAAGGALDTTNLVAFAEFARAAIRGEKRFVVTHSEIFPGTFASTTETADWLLGALALQRTAVLRWGPRGMQQLSEVHAGGFEVLGFAGNSAPDHIDHLHALPELLARALTPDPRAGARIEHSDRLAARSVDDRLRIAHDRTNCVDREERRSTAGCCICDTAR